MLRAQKKKEHNMMERWSIITLVAIGYGFGSLAGASLIQALLFLPVFACPAFILHCVRRLQCDHMIMCTWQQGHDAATQPKLCCAQKVPSIDSRTESTISIENVLATFGMGYIGGGLVIVALEAMARFGMDGLFHLDSMVGITPLAVTAWLVALIEESVKYMFGYRGYLIAKQNTPASTQSPTVALITHMCATAAGYSTTENVLYLSRGQSSTIGVRMLIRVFVDLPCHCIYASVTATQHLLVRGHKPWKLQCHQILLVILPAMVLHGLFDFLVFVVSSSTNACRVCQGGVQTFVHRDRCSNKTSLAEICSTLLRGTVNHSTCLDCFQVDSMRANCSEQREQITCAFLPNLGRASTQNGTPVMIVLGGAFFTVLFGLVWMWVSLGKVKQLKTSRLLETGRESTESDA